MRAQGPESFAEGPAGAEAMHHQSPRKLPMIEGDVRPVRAEGVRMSILLATALIIAIIVGCVLLAVAANLLTEKLARRLSTAELIRSAEALLRASASHQPH
jgi:hypothetical protein